MNGIDKSCTKEKYVFYIFLAVILARNLIFMVDGFGEQDAARLVNDAIIWSSTGQIPFLEYRGKTSPLFLSYLKLMIDSGLTVDTVAIVTNVASAISGALVIAFSFLIFRFFLSLYSSIATTVLLSFVPSLFFGSIYGFPAIIAFSFYIVSTWLFIISSKQTTKSVYLYAASFVFAIIAALCKADILITYFSYIAFFIFYNGFQIRALISICVAVMLTALVTIFYSKLFLPLNINHTGYAGVWIDQFPFSLQNLFSKENIDITTLSFGPIFLLLSCVGILFGISDKKYRYFVLLLALSLLPSIIFWGGRPGNSARHMSFMSIYIMLFCGFAIDFFSQKGHRKLVCSVLISAILISNYFSREPWPSTVITSTRIFESALLFNQSNDVLNNTALNLINTTYGDIAIIDSWTLPYSINNLLRKTLKIISAERLLEYDRIAIVDIYGKHREIKIVRAKSLQEAKELVAKIDERFFVFSSQYPEITVL
tara:strand:+ start:10767 stop:12215 length:1449 start_codon:yes stop_codon:yes gene_type:complete